MPFSTASILGVVEERRQFSPVLKGLFFSRRQFFATESIDLDKVKRKNKRAPFVSPIVAGKVRKRQGAENIKIYPAYLKPKDKIDSTELQNRLPGESYDTPLSPEQRRDAIVTQMVMEHDDEITITEEYLCAQIVKFGKMVIESEFYPKSEVNFGRKAENSIVLTGADRWTAQNKATYQLNKKLTQYMALSSRPIVGMVMNQNTYAEFVEFNDIEKLLETRRGSESVLETAAFNGALFVKKGELGGVEVWVYSGDYETEDGETEMFYEDGEISFIPAMAQGTMCYGMIHDKKANYQALERFPKEFEQDDPAGEFVMTQSAPIPVPENVNDFVYLKAY